MVKKLLIVLSIVASIMVAEICFVVSHASASETSEPAEKVLDMTKGAEATGITAIIDETIVATEESIGATETQPENVPTETELGCAELQESTANEENIPAETAAVFLELTEAEKDMLLRIGMAEVGGEECTECIALVMRVVLNRVESNQFANSIYWVIHAEGQFSPVESGAFEKAYPNKRCHEALEMVLAGWDESQGALYFESNSGPCWHSRNCELLFQHCNTEFYK